MLPGRFLGIARATGDSFTFIIVKDNIKTGGVLYWCIIQKRNFGSYEPYIDYTIPIALVQNNSTELHSKTSIYNHYNEVYKKVDIDDIIQLENLTDDKKLYTKVRWKNQQESMILADHIWLDDPSQLALFIRDNSVERTRTGYWNIWVRDTIHDISSTKRKLRRMYRNVSEKDQYYPYLRQTLRCQK